MKKYLIILLLVTSGVLAFGGNNFAFLKSTLSPAMPASEVAREVKKATVEIVDRGELRKYPDLEFKEGETALGLTRLVVEVETKGEGEQAFVTAISGKLADSVKKEFWSFLVNGKMAETGAGSYKVQNGDTITWKISTF
ncbi:MAG: hypothetical protein G01um10145_531 [Microgenomates group bacterium Gr01-1014_5]|nr:MAG: hypothetical protein G01um10145_531 [Microgenomates group bacterium Gr01-1014_5]